MPRARSQARFVAIGAIVAIVVTTVGIGGLARMGPDDDAGAPGPGLDPRPPPGPTFDPSISADPAALPRLEPVECRFTEPFWREVSCFDLFVPQDRSDAAKGVIRLHVARYPSRSSTPRPDPVVYLAGGPGGSALFDDEDFSFYPFEQHSDLIVLDQRGTGLSVPSLDCPELDGLDPFSLGSLFESRSGVRTCHDRLAAQGIALDSYTSAENAADIADLRLAMGVEQWNLYGISYGTRLALTVMRDHPEGVRSVILDAVYPPAADVYEQGARSANRAFKALFGACGSESACQQAHPNLQLRFYQLIRELDERPITLHADDLGSSWSVDGRVVIDFLFDRLYLTAIIPSLPSAIDDFSEGHWDQLIAYLEESYPDGIGRGRTGGDEIAEGMYLSVQCAEELAFFDRARYDEHSTGVIREIVDAFDPADLEADCRTWGVERAPSVETAPVTSDIPTLLLTGEYDPITPPEWAQDAARTLRWGKVLQFPSAGHGVLGDFPCADSIVNAFLADPKGRLDVRCLDDVGRPPFHP